MKRLSLILALALVVAACGDDTASTTTGADTTAPPRTTLPPRTTTTVPAPPSTLPPTTTLPSTTTGATAATTTTAPSSTTTAGSPFTTDDYGFFPDPLGTAADGHGSGCVIAGTTLTDGMWFGYVYALAGGQVTFDLACFFTGTAAQNAAAADGSEAFDFYIRNQNPLTFSVPLDAGGSAYWLDGTSADLSPQEIAMTAWPMSFPPSYQECPGDYCSVWLFVNDGEVTELVEQYLP